MSFPKLLQDPGWHLPASRHDPHPGREAADAVSPPRGQRRLQALALITTLAGLGAAAGLDLVHDPRPLDEQAGATLRRAGEALQGWQAQLARGLQVSLRAVADGRDTPPPEALDPAQAGNHTAGEAGDLPPPLDPSCRRSPCTPAQPLIPKEPS